MTEVEFVAPVKGINVEIPQPLKWHVIIEPLQAKESSGPIELLDETKKQEEFSTTVGRVVALGPVAFTNPKLGDLKPELGGWVMYPTYAGTRIEMTDGRVYQLMNDDTITALVVEPELYRKKLV